MARGINLDIESRPRMYLTSFLLKSHSDKANWTHNRSFFISAHNETAKKNRCIVYRADVWICFVGSRGGDKIKISNRTRRLSPRGFLLVITGR